jgi:hypothetical protein
MISESVATKALVQQFSHSQSRNLDLKACAIVRFPYTNAFQLSSFGDSDAVIKNFRCATVLSISDLRLASLSVP